MDAHDHSRRVPSALEDFVALLEAHGASLFRYLLKMVGDRALAEDLLQETFASAFGHRNEFRQPGSVRAWLFTIARNRARNALRDGRRTVTDSAADRHVVKPAHGIDLRKAGYVCGENHLHVPPAELEVK